MLGAAPFAALLVPGCTQFEPGTDELADNAVLRQNPTAGRDWTCVAALEEEPRELVPESFGSTRLVQSLRMVSLVTGDAIPGLTIRACSQRDVDCANPLTEPIPLSADGWVDMPLFEGFAGFLEITGDAIVPMALFYPAPVERGGQVYSTPVSLVERALLPSLSLAAGVEQDPLLGLVVLRAYDCQGEGALDVRYSIDKAGSPWYFVAGLPSTAASATADSGLGGFMNVAPGVVVVDAELSPIGSRIVTPTSVLVRAGWMTAIRFFPRDAGAQ